MSKDLPPSRTAEQFVVRFPDGMRSRISEAAKAAGRSMNAEIIWRLQDSLRQDSEPADAGESDDFVRHLSTVDEKILLELQGQLAESLKRAVEELMEKARLQKKP